MAVTFTWYTSTSFTLTEEPRTPCLDNRGFQQKSENGFHRTVPYEKSSHFFKQ